MPVNGLFQSGLPQRSASVCNAQKYLTLVQNGQVIHKTVIWLNHAPSHGHTFVEFALIDDALSGLRRPHGLQWAAPDFCRN
jgi:hypothetical protein